MRVLPLVALLAPAAVRCAGALARWRDRLLPQEAPAAGRLDRRFWLGLCAVALVAGLVHFTNLSYPLIEPDEGRHAEIAREMLDSGDWLVPTYFHRPYYNKPALFYWLVAGALAAFGKHAWAARLIPATAALLTVLATYVFGCRTLGLRAALFAALALALGAGFALSARFLIVDGVLTLYVALALYFAYASGRSARWGRLLWVASAVFCGLGILSKGLVSVAVVAPVIVFDSHLVASMRRRRARDWLVYGGIALGLALPWYVAVMLREPEFFERFIVDHHLRRFTGEQHHSQPLWFYLPIVLLGLQPWTPLLLAGLWLLLGGRRDARGLWTAPVAYAALWAALGLLFFSLSHGKLPTYLLPLSPAFALLCGAALDHLLKQGEAAHRPTAALNVLVFLVQLGLLLGCAALGVAAHVVAAPLGSVLCAAGAVVGLAALGWWLLRRCRAPLGAWACCAGAAAAVLLAAGLVLVPAVARQRSPAAADPRILALLREPGTGVVFFGDEWGSIAFHTDRDDDLLVNAEKDSVRTSQFLRRHPRNVLLASRWLDPACVERSVPDGMRMTLIRQSKRTRTLIVERIGP